jgi:hypothetical protein
MKLEIDAEANEVSFSLHPEVYGEDSLRVAAAVFEKKAEVYEDEEGGKAGRRVTLAPRRKSTDADLQALAGDFMNELLNVEYRKLVTSMNKNLSTLLVTQALFAARGGENGPPPLAPLSEAQEAEVQKMMAEAREEIAKTMPKRLPPQGAPIQPKTEKKAKAKGGK